MDLVYECFVKLGLRYICVLKDGKFAGMVSSWLLCDPSCTKLILTDLS
jgi:hypothetical protein